MLQFTIFINHSWKVLKLKINTVLSRGFFIFRDLIKLGWGEWDQRHPAFSKRFSYCRYIWWFTWMTIVCSKTTLAGKSRFHISSPHGIEPRTLMMGSKCRFWSRKEDLQRGWNWDRRAVWDQAALSHCQHDGLVTVRDEACLRRGHNDQSRRGHQCSKTTLTGESRFYKSTPLWIEPGSLMTGSKRVDHLTSGTVYECSEIAGSP